MPAVADEPIADELEDVFDLDIQVKGLEPDDPDRIHRAQTIYSSCTNCCPTLYPVCGQSDYVCPAPSEFPCTGPQCN